MKNTLFIILLFAIGAGFAQQPDDRQDILDQLADELLATAEADISYDELYETLAHLLANPIDLNAVTREQLRAGLILNEGEINSFLEYRDKLGPLLSTLELQAIPLWSPATLRRILPFATVRDPNTKFNKRLLQRIVNEENTYLVARYERTAELKKGYNKGIDSAQRFLGSPDKYYLRFRTSRSNDFSLGFTAEKDPGEPLVWNPSSQQLGLDFLSGHIQVMKKGRVENVILGDYQCQFGQGLQLGSVFGLGKSAETITGIRRSNLGFLPYTSAGESLFLRGIASSFRLTGQIRMHAFLSYQKRDAVLDIDEPRISSLQNSGLHRTPKEIQSQKSVDDRDAGMVIQFRDQHIDAGIMITEKSLGVALTPNATPYNLFQFTGTSYANAGGYFNLTWANVTLFSEFAHTLGNGTAMTAGILGNLTPKFEMAWLYRHFSSSYFSAYANAFAESSTPQNERGFYWGAKYTLNRRISVTGYLDMFEFPWLRYRIYQPSDGHEWLIRLNYSPSRTVTFFLQAREETKIRNLAQATALYTTLPGVKRNFWASCDFSPTPLIMLKTRIQGSQYDIGEMTTRGVAVVQDVTLRRPRWSVSLRYALFDTDDYENRQYVYEKDVWLATSLPAYEGAGFRNYVLIHYVLSRRTDIWARWSRTRYTDREAIGSGADEIDGNTRNDVKFQVRIRF